MDNQEEFVQVEQETVEQEETTQSDNTDNQQDETVVITKEKFKAMQEKAIKFDESLKNHNKEPIKKSDDFGYDVKAYLKTSGINSNEFDFVKSELNQSGLKDVDTLLENPYFKASLEKFRAEKQTIDATPKGNRSGGVPTDSIEYWASKPIEEVPTDMRIKVVNHQLQKEKTKGVFYNN